MPLTHSAKITNKTTKSTLRLTPLSFKILTTATLLVVVALRLAVAIPQATSSSAGQYNLDGYLKTQTLLIDSFRQYIDAFEHKINNLKRKTIQIKSINDLALTDIHKYVNNPLNALTILKRLTSDWQILQQYAFNVHNTTEIAETLTFTKESLKFPSESDFDAAASNLLHIQDIYQLDPKRLAVGEVNGVKMGSTMSWSDCLEIGRKSMQNGDFMIGKFWIEVALGKLPNQATTHRITHNTSITEKTFGTNDVNGEIVKARLEIAEAMVEVEFSLGNLDVALDMVNELLLKHPKVKYLRKTKRQIEKELRKHSKTFVEKFKNNISKRSQSDKSVEETLIEDICRTTTNIHATTTSAQQKWFAAYQHDFKSQKQYCRHLDGNLPVLLLQPLQVELLSLDPYVAIYHNVMHAHEINQLQELTDAVEGSNGDEVALKSTRLVQQKLRNIANRLQITTGHASSSFAEWKVERWTHEDDDVYIKQLVPLSTKAISNVLFNLQTATLGGAIVFPQLEFSVQLPPNALLYWTRLNEYHDYDYRSKQNVCPVIVGTQITAYTSIRAGMVMHKFSLKT